MLLLLALLPPALACDPVDFELASSFPVADQAVSGDAAPLVHAWTYYAVDLQIRDADGELLPGTQQTQDVQGWSTLLRFVPAQAMAPGEYDLIVDIDDAPDRTEVIPFTVDDQTPTLGTAAVRDPAAEYVEYIEAGQDMCDSRAQHRVELTWDVPDASATDPVALVVYQVAGLEGSLPQDPVYVGRASVIDQRSMTLSIYTEDDGPEDLCFAVSTLGVAPAQDATSATFCIEEAREGPGNDGVGGCHCSTAAGGPAGGVLAILGLLGGVLVRRRRRP